MILADTSVWIRFLRGSEPYAEEMDRLLSRDEILGHDFVYGELMIGDPGRRERLLAAYAKMSHATTVDHVEVVDFTRRRNLAGRGIGCVQIGRASCRERV